MSVRLYFASILVLVASPAWLARAQQSPQTGAFMTDRDKAGLRGPVKTVLNEQTLSGADGQQFLMSTTKGRYAPDGRILEQRTKNPDGSEWVTSYTYRPDGRLLKTTTGNAGSTDRSETTYLYDGSRRLVAVKSGGNVQTRYQYDDAGRKSAIESYDSKPLPPNTAYAAHWEGTDLAFAPSPGLAHSQRRTTGRGWRRVRTSMMLKALSWATLCASSMQKVASSQRNRLRMLLS